MTRLLKVGRCPWKRSVPSAVADGCGALNEVGAINAKCSQG